MISKLEHKLYFILSIILPSLRRKINSSNPSRDKNDSNNNICGHDLEHLQTQNAN